MDEWETTNLNCITVSVSYSGAATTPQSIAAALATAIENMAGGSVTAAP